MSSCSQVTNQYFTREPNKKRNLPFSEAVKVGDKLYLSGAIGIVPGKSKVVDGGFKAQTRQTMMNIKEILEYHKLGMKNLIKCQVMIMDMSLFKEFNDEYRKFFFGKFPARSTYAVKGLALEALVEIECLAQF